MIFYLFDMEIVRVLPYKTYVCYKDNCLATIMSLLLDKILNIVEFVKFNCYLILLTCWMPCLQSIHSQNWGISEPHLQCKLVPIEKNRYPLVAMKTCLEVLWLAFKQPSEDFLGSFLKQLNLTRNASEAKEFYEEYQTLDSVNILAKFYSWN